MVNGLGLGAWLRRLGLGAWLMVWVRRKVNGPRLGLGAGLMVWV